MISGLAICSLEAFKVSAPCRRTRRLPYKVDFFTFPREQNVNKSWVNKQLTLVYGIFESSKIISSVNKQLTVYSTIHLPSPAQLASTNLGIGKIRTPLVNIISCKTDYLGIKHLLTICCFHQLELAWVSID